jgi:hypothetical protein
MTNVPNCEFCGDEIFSCDCPTFCMVCEGIHRPSEDCDLGDLLDAGLEGLD